MQLIARLVMGLVALGILGGCTTLPVGNAQVKGVEYEVPRADLQEVHRSGRLMVADGELLDYVNTVLQRLEAAHGEPCDCVVMIDTSNGYEAYTVSSHTIVLSAGLMAQVESEDELAAVIAHELSHIVEGDTTKSTLQDAVVMMARVGGIAAENAYSMAFGDAIKEAANGLIFNRWDEQQERDADAFAVELLAKAGYSQQGMKMFIRRIGLYSDSATASQQDSEPHCLANGSDNQLKLNVTGCAIRLTGSQDSVYDTHDTRLQALNETIWTLSPEDRRRRPSSSPVPHFPSTDYLYRFNGLVSTSEAALRAGLSEVERRPIPAALRSNAYVYNHLAQVHIILGNEEKGREYFWKTIESDYRTSLNYKVLLDFANKSNDSELVSNLIIAMHNDLGSSPEMLPYEYYLTRRHELTFLEAQAWARCGLYMAKNIEIFNQCAEFGKAGENNRMISI